MVPFSSLENGSQAEWISGLATFAATVVALGGYWLVEWQRRRIERTERRKSAHSIGRKLSNLCNQLDDIRRHFQPLKDDWKNDKRRGLPNIQPMIGMTFDEAIRLDKEESALLIELSEGEFLSNFDLLVAHLSALVVSVNEYRGMYENFYQKLPSPTSMKGDTASHPMTDAEFIPLLPHKLAIYNFVASIRDNSLESTSQAKKLAVRYHPMMKRHFSKEKFLSISFADL